MDEPIPVFRPSLGREEVEALGELFRGGWIGLGPKTREFEERFGAYVGARHAVAVNSATAALHAALAAFDIGPGDEVLVPAITFVSTAHAVLYTGATPVFVDVDPATLCMDAADMRRKISPRTRAAIPVHYGGHPCEMDEIVEASRRHGILVIEDAAHACGAEYRGRRIGSIGDATCFSFQAVKNLSTGDGGMIVTDNPDVARALARIRWLGIDASTWDRTAGPRDGPGADPRPPYGWYYEVVELGFKYHMNDIAATIGLVQLGRLDRLNARRRELAGRYTEALRGVDWLEVPVERGHVRSALHAYVIRTGHRDALHRHLGDRGIATGVHYMPLHLHPYYRRRFAADVPVAERVWTTLLTLPLYPDLGDPQQQRVIDSIRSFRPSPGAHGHA